MHYSRLGFAAILIVCFASAALADTLYHENGQVINGTIIEETAGHITIMTDDYGRLRFERKVIDRLMRGGVEVSASDLSNVTEPVNGSNNNTASTPANSSSLSNPFSMSDSTSSSPGNPFGPAAPSQPDSSNVPPPPPANTGGNSPFSTAQPTSSSPFEAPEYTTPPVTSVSEGSPFATADTPTGAGSSPFAAPPSGGSSPFAAPAGSGNASSPFNAPDSGTSAPAGDSPFAVASAPANTSSPFSESPSNAAASSPFAQPGAPAIEEEIELPPAFQLSGESSSSSNNPLSVSDVPEPVIINSAEGFRPSRITRNHETPSEVPYGSDAVIYATVKDVRVLMENNGWVIPQGNTPVKAGIEIWSSLGKTKMLLKNDATIFIPPNTHVKLDRSADAAPALEVDLKAGHIWLNVPPPSSMAIDTPDLKATLQPGLYAIGTETGQYTRLAVFEGSAEGFNNTSNLPFSLVANQAIMGSGEQGTLCPPYACKMEERREFDEWDWWAFEIHTQMSKEHMFKGAVPALSQTPSGSGGSRNDTRSLVSLEEDHLTDIKGAFMQFCIDTGQAPTTDQGFSALVRNPGINSWRGPYFKGDIPPTDNWGMPIRYSLKRDPGTGRLVGEILSAGPNRIYSDGRSDDVMIVVPFYRYMR